MKKLLIFTLLAVMITSCRKDPIDEDDNSNPTYNLEGRWYISGCTLEYVNQVDSGRYNYNDKVLGYQEFIFKQIHGEENYYSVHVRMIDLKQRDGENEVDYLRRYVSGDYSLDELYMTENLETSNWFISGNDIWCPYENRKYKGIQLGKIVKWSNEQFTMASASVCINFWGIEYKDRFPYYFTLKRIK